MGPAAAFWERQSLKKMSGVRLCPLQSRQTVSSPSSSKQPPEKKPSSQFVPNILLLRVLFPSLCSYCKTFKATDIRLLPFVLAEN